MIYQEETSQLFFSLLEQDCLNPQKYKEIGASTNRSAETNNHYYYRNACYMLLIHWYKEYHVRFEVIRKNVRNLSYFVVFDLNELIHASLVPSSSQFHPICFQNFKLVCRGSKV